MHIQVKHDFSGRVTNERWIKAGVYALSDERLFGIAQYLLDNDHAIPVALPEAQAPAPIENVPVTRKRR